MEVRFWNEEYFANNNGCKKIEKMPEKIIVLGFNF